MGNPAAVTLNRIIAKATGEIVSWLMDRRHRRTIPHRLERCGYVQVHNDGAKDGLWVIHGRRQVIYARNKLSIRDRFAAATWLASQ